MKKLSFVLLIIFSACETKLDEDTSIVTSTYRSRNSNYKYLVRVADIESDGDYYYLYTNTNFLVGDTLKYSR